MALDTNVKKFKYSPVFKCICVLLSLITFCGSVALASLCTMTYIYNEGERPESYTQSNAFEHSFSSDVGGIANDAYASVMSDDFTEELEQARDSAVSSACEDYLEIGRSVSADEIYSDGADYYYSDDDRFYASILVNVQTSFGTYVFETSYDRIYSDCNSYAYAGDEDGVKTAVNALYDNFISDKLDEMINENFTMWSDYRQRKNSLHYYTLYADTDYILTNIEDFNEQRVYDSEVYFVCKNGQLSYQGISEDLADEIYESYISGNKYAQNTDIFVYLDFPMDEIANPSLLDHIRTYDTYQGIKSFYSTAVKGYDHFALYVIAAAVLLILSFIFAFLYLPAAGQKEEGAAAKLAFIDYVPFEIHLGVYIALGFGATALLAGVAEYLYLSTLTVAAIVIYAAVIWLMLFEFCASVARCILSERKLYKNFLVYYIGRLVFILIKKLIELDIKIFKAAGRRVRKSNAMIKNAVGILSYKPTKFKRNVIRLSVLYVLANLLAIVIIFPLYSWSTYAYSAFPAFLAVLLTLGDIAANVYVFMKVLKYIEQLDMLIDTASRHEDVTLDSSTLPQSLSILAESMKYTNAELQNAVAKAVKDERLKTELITNVSHDLKTPLTSIITYVDLLSKCDIPDEKAREYISVLGDKGTKLKRLIDDLMEASKINSGNITVNPSNLNLYELCLQATVEAQKDFEKAGLELIVKESEDAPAIFADGPKSFRIIENLLSNAKKYSAKNTRVYVSVYRENGMGVFEIKNISAQPLDISPDELTQRFVRGDKSRNQEGNGLGLSIAKELCRVQNGSLEISIDGDLFKAKVKLPLANT